MKAMMFAAAVIATVCCSASVLRAQDIEKLSRSDVWQVRYGVIDEFKVATPEARAILERLALDDHRKVARRAFGVYTDLFVDVNKDLAQQAFDRGYFDLVGATNHATGEVVGTTGKEFRTVEFYLGELARRRAGRTVVAVIALGLLDDKTVLPQLAELRDGTDPQLLAHAALACHRLGSDDDYLAILEALLAPPFTANKHYQTRAVDYLLQTHPEKARTAWDRMEQERARYRNLEPAWVYAHFAQRDRLPPRNAGTRANP